MGTWDIDRFSGSPQFLLKPSHYSLPKIKRLKITKVLFASPKFHVHQVEFKSFVLFSLSTSLPSHSLPYPIAQAGPRVFLWYVLLVHCWQACFDILLAFSPVSTFMPYGWFEERRIEAAGGQPQGWKLWVHLSVQPISSLSLCSPAAETVLQY